MACGPVTDTFFPASILPVTGLSRYFSGVLVLNLKATACCFVLVKTSIVDFSFDSKARQTKIRFVPPEGHRREESQRRLTKGHNRGYEGDQRHLWSEVPEERSEKKKNEREGRKGGLISCLTTHTGENDHGDR